MGVASMFNRPTLCALIAIAVASRLLPHPPNFVFLAALGLFSGCFFRGAKVVVVPLAALLISDAIGHLAGLQGMGFYHPLVMVGVYTGIGFSGLIGMGLRKRRTAVRIASASFLCSATFFLSSNAAVWLTSNWALSWSGLIACYSAALPFFQYTLAGDLFYATLTFGSLALWHHRGQFTRGRLVPAAVASRVAL
jgi:hypothetical protein